MPQDNLLVALRKYTKGNKADPFENFLTEAFAWLLRQHEVLSIKLLYHVAGRVSQPVKEWLSVPHLEDLNERDDVG